MSVQDSPSEAEIVTPAKKSKQGGNFSIEEDKLLVLAWLNISVDAVYHGNNDQNNKAPFCSKIAKYFHEHKKDCTSKFCEVFAKVEAKNPNATAEQMKVSIVFYCNALKKMSIA